jgi:hypothetical protein
MTIRVKKLADDLYTAELTLPDMPGITEAWSPESPMTGHQLTRSLVDRGCHTTDIGDALYAVDPLWVEKLRGEYLPPAPDASPFIG